MFQPRFAPKVEDGTKRQTIRPERKDGRTTKIGDELSLRSWIGKPYRSKQRLLLPVKTCSDCADVSMQEEPFPGGGVYFVLKVAGQKQSIPGVEEIAKADGFKDGFEMWKWFKDTHGLPFKGEIIRW